MNNIDPEIAAMTSISAALETMEDQEARDRVLRWATDKFGSQVDIATLDTDKESLSGEVVNDDASYAGFVDLFDAVKPSSQIDMALTAGYWLQVIGGNEAWNSFNANKILKDLGYGIGSISKVFVRAQEQSPALVRQTSKSGKTAQAKKTYKLTQAGISFVKGMLGG